MSKYYGEKGHIMMAKTSTGLTASPNTGQCGRVGEKRAQSTL